MKNKANIIYLGNKVQVSCDRKCNKAWGWNSRPQKPDNDMLTDEEVGSAPIDPGTYEGGVAKPLNPDNFPNKWCVRECERCKMEDIEEIAGSCKNQDSGDFIHGPKRYF